MTLASHFHFVLAAYGATVLVLGALIVWVMLDYRALKRALAGLEDQGVTRRSSPARSPL